MPAELSQEGCLPPARQPIAAPPPPPPEAQLPPRRNSARRGKWQPYRPPTARRHRPAPGIPADRLRRMSPPCRHRSPAAPGGHRHSQTCRHKPWAFPAPRAGGPSPPPDTAAASDCPRDQKPQCGHGPPPERSSLHPSTGSRASGALPRATARPSCCRNLCHAPLAP